MGGVLSRQELLRMMQEGTLIVPNPATNQVQPGSIDLRLGSRVWALRTGFLPREDEDVEEALERFSLFTFSLDEEEPHVLEKDRTYVIELQEGLSLPGGLVAECNPKSSTGRADVMTRVLVSGERKFDTIHPGKNRKLYIECTPLSFNTLVHKGLMLTQLRISNGNGWLTEQELAAIHEQTPLLYEPDNTVTELQFRHHGVEMTVDLESPIVAYRAKINSQSSFNLAGGRGSAIGDKDLFWEAIPKPANGELVLEPGCFYLLATRERTSFPHTVCGVLEAYDVTSTEGRVHYAGFLDPGFGFGKGELKGTAVTLEVRLHHKPFRIVHGQPICVMRYQKMSQVPQETNGDLATYGVGRYKSNYQGQRGPTLGKQFL